jgi:hypothetical protein
MYCILERTTTINVHEDGRQLSYRELLTIRSRRHELHECRLRLQWSGETDLANSYKQVGDGFTVTVVPRDKLAGIVEFVFSFEPIGRWRKKRVGIEFELLEPSRKYNRSVGYSSLSDYFAITSRIVAELNWDQSEAVRRDTIRALEYRSRWDRFDNSLAMKTWSYTDFKDSNPGPGIRWKISPVRPDRWYNLQWCLKDDDTQICSQPSPTPGVL